MTSEHAKGAFVTVQDVLITSALRRQFRPLLAAMEAKTGGVMDAETRADIAKISSLGNMLKTWLRHGDGVFRGKANPQHALHIHRAPNGDERLAVERVLAEMTATLVRLRGSK